MQLLADLPTIPYARLALTLAPVVLVVALLHRWSLSPGGALWATVRMVVQLSVLGVVLKIIFRANHPAAVFAAVTVMVMIAAWIALRTAGERTFTHYRRILASIALGGGATLALVTQGVLVLEPWFKPSVLVPIAGMVFANAMNTIALAGERFSSETGLGSGYLAARQTAMRAAMIPATNALLAVGLVSIPGMFTGQVLSGEDPMIAARYQMMVMAMVYGSAGLSAGCYLAMMRPGAVEPVSGPHREL
ncbi:MAG: ABC transporter permease [Planctomycetales bacterium]|nr:ABC transporter permease [Planctomycetales bacterium]